MFLCVLLFLFFVLSFSKLYAQSWVEKLKAELPDFPEEGRLYNPEAIVPPQCYTKTEAKFNLLHVSSKSHR